MQRNKFTFRSAFSMLELVLVIVILGIVSSIGAEIIAKVYENYIVQRALHHSSLKTGLVATQIANRLTYAIPDTVIARLSDSTFTAIEDATDKTYNKLEWIAYDADSFKYTGTPGWSGFCDVDSNNTDTNNISTPGSNLDLSNTIITKLSNTTKDLTDAAILFPGIYNVHTVGFNETTSNSTGISKIASKSGTTLTLNPVTVGTRKVKEHYKLAWTAYAVVPTQITDTNELKDRGFKATDIIYDLALYYNYQPWNGESYSSNGSNKTLIRNVSVFNFKGTGDTIRFKLCIQENIGQTYPITICKERAVIR